MNWSRHAETAVGVLWTVCMVGFVVFAFLKVSSAPGKPTPLKPTSQEADIPFFAPEEGMVSKCTVTRVVDGDTLDIEITIPMRVRLLGMDAPELNKPGGKESYQNLKNKAEGKVGMVQIPWDDITRFGGIMSFDRVLAHVWVKGENVAISQIQDKHGVYRGK